MKTTGTRRRGFVGAAFALISIAATYASVNLQLEGFEAQPSAENYLSQRALEDYAHGAIALLSGLTPFLAIAIGIVGRARLATISGILALAFIVIWLPGQLRACCGGVESSAIGMLRAINSSQQAYASSCANGKYATTIADLRKAPLVGGTPFIFEGAETGYWYGYRVTMHAPDAAPMEKEACNGVRVGAATYFVEAHYIDPKVGRRNFATDEKGTIYSTSDGSVIEPGMAGAQPIQ